MPDIKVELKRRGICVIVPTYNNAGTVVDVVSRIQAFCSDIFVVCDGCTDGTVSLLKSMQDKPHIIEIPHNSGKGNALKVGFKAALDAGYAFSITIDADGQHFPEDIPVFLEANRRHPDSIIVGCRTGLDDVQRSKSSRFANQFSNFWFFLQTFCPLKDSQTGYRLYPLRRLRGLSLLTSRYEAELELLVISSWLGVKIISRDVRVYYPPKEERVSHFRPIYDFVRISILNVVLCILAFVFALPFAILRFCFNLIKTVAVFLIYVLSMLLVIMPGMLVYIKFGTLTEEKKEKIHNIICRLARFAIVKPGLPGVRYTLVNESQEDFSKPSIIICNHQSHIDLLPMLALTPKLVILTADWVWNNPLYGFIIRNIDYLPASRGIETIAPSLKQLSEKGYSILVFPEGTRSLDCTIGRFHQGAFFLADTLKMDILPIILYGSGKALPKHGRILRRWSVRAQVDKRVSHLQYRESGETLLEQASRMRKYYIGRYSDISDEIEQTLK